jgi:endonuclease/exonuclease/phosphatase family metal-dependent hydrolase
MVAHGSAYLSLMELVNLATFNIRHGLGLDGEIDLGRTAEAILETESEFIALQELDRNRERSKHVDQPEQVAELTGLTVSFWPTVKRKGGEYGIAIASRGPVEATFESLPRIGTEEPRGVIIGRVPGHEASFIATHLSTDRPARRVQTTALIDIVGNLEKPVIVMGDMNQGRFGLRRLRKAGFDAGRRIEHTLTTRSLRWQIDFILVGPGAQLAATRTITSEASDHVPLVAEVGLGLI